MFSAFAAGAFLVVSGAIGWDISHMHGIFQGGRWTDGPLWGHLALGAGFLALGVYWSRRLGEPNPTSPVPRAQTIKNVGRGKTPGADRNRRLTSGEP